MKTRVWVWVRVKVRFRVRVTDHVGIEEEKAAARAHGVPRFHQMHQHQRLGPCGQVVRTTLVAGIARQPYARDMPERRRIPRAKVSTEDVQSGAAGNQGVSELAAVQVARAIKTERAERYRPVKGPLGVSEEIVVNA